MLQLPCHLQALLLAAWVACVHAQEDDVEPSPSNSGTSNPFEDPGSLSTVVILVAFVIVVIIAAVRREMRNRDRFRDMMADLCDRPLLECPPELMPESGIWSGVSEESEICPSICPIAQRTYRWTVAFNQDGTFQGTGSDDDSSFSISGKFTVEVPVGRSMSFGRTCSPSFNAKTTFIWLETKIAAGKHLEEGLTVNDHVDIARRHLEGDTICGRLTCHCCQDLEVLKVCRGSLQVESSEVSITGTFLNSRSSKGTFTHRLISLTKRKEDRTASANASSGGLPTGTETEAPSALNSQRERTPVASLRERADSYRSEGMRGPPNLNERGSQFDSIRSNDTKDSRQSKGIMKKTEHSNPPSLYQSQESQPSSLKGDWKRSHSMRESARRRNGQPHSHRRVNSSRDSSSAADIARDPNGLAFHHLDDQVHSIKENEEIADDGLEPARSPSSSGQRIGGRHLRSASHRRAASARDAPAARESSSPPPVHEAVSPKISWRDGYDSKRSMRDGTDSTGTRSNKVSWRDGFDSESQKVSFRDDVPGRQPSSGDSQGRSSRRDDMIPLPTDDESRHGFKPPSSSDGANRHSPPDAPPRQGSGRAWLGMGGIEKHLSKSQKKGSPTALVTKEDSPIVQISADLVEAPSPDGRDMSDASYRNLKQAVNERGSALSRHRGKRESRAELEEDATLLADADAHRAHHPRVATSDITEAGYRRDGGRQRNGYDEGGAGQGNRNGSAERLDDAQPRDRERGARKDVRELARSGSSRSARGQQRAPGNGEGGRAARPDRSTPSDARNGNRPSQQRGDGLVSPPPAEERRGAPHKGGTMLTPRGGHLVT